MRRRRCTKILATLGPSSSTHGADPQPVRGRRRRLPAEPLARHPRAARRALSQRARGRGGDRAADRGGGRPAGPEAAGRPVSGGPDRAARRARRSVSTWTRRPATSAGSACSIPRSFAPPRRAPSSCSTTAGSGFASPRSADERARDHGAARRRALGRQGRQPAQRGPAALGDHRQGPPGSAVRPRSRRRLDRAQLRAAARRRRRGAPPDRRPGRDHGQDREARGGRPARRDHRSRRRHHDRARRPRRRAAARGRAGTAEAHDPGGARGRQAGGGRDPDAGIDDRARRRRPGPRPRTSRPRSTTAPMR